VFAPLLLSSLHYLLALAQTHVHLVMANARGECCSRLCLQQAGDDAPRHRDESILHKGFARAEQPASRIATSPSKKGNIPKQWFTWAVEFLSEHAELYRCTKAKLWVLDVSHRVLYDARLLDGFDGKLSVLDAAGLLMHNKERALKSIGSFHGRHCCWRNCCNIRRERMQALRDHWLALPTQYKQNQWAALIVRDPLTGDERVCYSFMNDLFGCSTHRCARIFAASVDGPFAPTDQRLAPAHAPLNVTTAAVCLIKLCILCRFALRSKKYASSYPASVLSHS
jgi:hypothetical protein